MLFTLRGPVGCYVLRALWTLLGLCALGLCALPLLPRAMCFGMCILFGRGVVFRCDDDGPMIMTKKGIGRDLWLGVGLVSLFPLSGVGSLSWR